MSEVIEQPTVMDPIQAAVDELIELGKKQGYVTWEVMNEILPDDAIDPSQLEITMMRLEENKIEETGEREVMVIEAQDRPGELGDLSRRLANAGANIDLSYVVANDRLVIGVDDIDKARAAL